MSTAALIFASLCVMQPMEEVRVAKVTAHTVVAASTWPVPLATRYEVFVLKKVAQGGEPFYRVVSDTPLPITPDGMMLLSACTAHG